jgi:pimeloyl-ACP methyl ester carboxylesterase
MHLSWPTEVRRQANFNLYALDLPGHGKSDAAGGLQTIDAYADRVLDWMQAVGLSRAAFVGHSMGGAIALSLALHAPERVSGLGLVSTGARLQVNPDLLADAANATTFYKVVGLLNAWSFGPEAPDRLVELARQRLAEVRPSVLYGDLLACNAFDVSEQIGKITSPTLVLSGTADRMVPMRNAQFIADSIPGAELVLIPQAGHMVMLEQPVVVAQALTSFLQRIH